MRWIKRHIKRLKTCDQIKPSWGRIILRFPWDHSLWSELSALISCRFQTNYSIAVLPMSKIKIVCPNPAMIPTSVMGSIPQEEMYENLWMVNKQAYDNCTINSSNRNKLLMECDTPLHLRYFTIVFQRFSAVGPSGLEFEPGKEYYFIGKITIHSCISDTYIFFGLIFSLTMCFMHFKAQFVFGWVCGFVVVVVFFWCVLFLIPCDNFLR